MKIVFFFLLNGNAEVEVRQNEIHSLTFKTRVSSDLSHQDEKETWQSLWKQGVWMIACTGGGVGGGGESSLHQMMENLVGGGGGGL